MTKPHIEITANILSSIVGDNFRIFKSYFKDFQILFKNVRHEKTDFLQPRFFWVFVFLSPRPHKAFNSCF